MKTRIPRAFFLFPVVAAAAAALALPQAAWAQAVDIAVLQSEMTDVKAAIIRMDKRLDRMGERIERMDEKFTRRFNSVEKSIVRLDEKMNAQQMQNQFIFIPLMLLTLASLIGLLTKGILWGVERAPQASSGASRRGRPATQPTAVAP